MVPLITSQKAQRAEFNFMDDSYEISSGAFALLIINEPSVAEYQIYHRFLDDSNVIVIIGTNFFSELGLTCSIDGTELIVNVTSVNSTHMICPIEKNINSLGEHKILIHSRALNLWLTPVLVMAHKVP